MTTLSDVKTFMRIDHDEEDTLLSSLLMASESYIKNATHINVDTTSPLFDLGQQILVGHWYENREAVGKTSGAILFGLDSILTQLMYTTEESS